MAASHKIGRRRAAMARGALGVLIVAGVAAAIALPGQFDRSATTAAAPFTSGAKAGRGAEQGVAPESAGDAASSPGQGLGPPVAGAAPSPAGPPRADQPFTGTPLGPGASECADLQDPAVRNYVEQALPEVTGAPEVPMTMQCQHGGDRGITLQVSDGGAPGVLSVRYRPPGVAPQPQPTGTEAVTKRTASGGTVTVSSRPATSGGVAPFAARLSQVSAYLAPRL